MFIIFFFINDLRRYLGKVKEEKFRKSYYKLMQVRKGKGREGKSMKGQVKDTKGKIY